MGATNESTAPTNESSNTASCNPIAIADTYALAIAQREQRV
jgi:hypothetical protein